MAATTPSERPTRPWHLYKWRVAAAASLGFFAFVIAFTLIFLVLTPIAEDFDVTLRTVGWVTIIDSLIVVALLLPLGALADRVGHKRTAVWGSTIFGLGIAATALAPTFELLLAARVLGAFGNALVQSTLTGILVGAFPPEERGLAFGMQTTAVASGAAMGPLLGGIGLEFLDWNVLFLMLTVPVAISVIALQLLLRDDSGERDTTRSWDARGSALSAIAVVLLVIVIANPLDFGYSSASMLAAMAGLAVSIVAFVRVELGMTNPMIDVRWFVNPVFGRAALMRIGGFIAATTTVLLLPVYLFTARQVSGTSAGLVLFCGAVSLGASAQIAGRLYDRLGPRTPALLGLTLQTAMMLGFAASGADTPLAILTLLNMGAGFAQSMWNVPANSALMGEIPKSRFGVAGAFTNVNRTMGNLLGQTVITVVVGSVMAAKGFDVPLGDVDESAGATGAFLDGFRIAYLVAAAATMAMMPLAWRLPTRGASR